MSANPPVACRNASQGCSGYAVERGLCPKCAKENPRKLDHSTLRHKTRRHPIYDTYQWKHKTKPTMMAYNAQCQFLVDGVQCSKAAILVHHIVSPWIDVSLGHKPQNLVCLCYDHHHQGEGDDPDNPRPYVPTKHRAGFERIEYPHPIPAKLTEGQVRITDDGRAIIGS